MDTFHMVIKAEGKGSEKTSKRHGTYQEAFEEAQRLSRKAGGDAYVILVAKDVVRSPVVCEAVGGGTNSE